MILSSPGVASFVKKISALLSFFVVAAAAATGGGGCGDTTWRGTAVCDNAPPSAKKKENEVSSLLDFFC